MAGELVNASTGYNINQNSQVIVDGSLGGQNGAAPMIDKYVQNAADKTYSWHIRVVEFPRWTYLMSDPVPWQRAIKALWEVHAIVTGIQFGLTADYLEQQVTFSNKVQYDSGQVIEASSSLNTSLPDKYGQYFYTLLHAWLKLSVGDPKTGRPGIAAVNPEVRDALPDLFSCSLLCFSTDPLNRKVKNAVYIVNVAPRSDGAPDGWKDHTSAPRLNEMSIDWTGYQDTGYGVVQRAQEELDNSGLFGLNPDARAGYFDIAPTVRSTSGGAQSVIDTVKA